MTTHHSASEQETAQIAAVFASCLKTGDIVCLEGPLGAGKSVFARALVRALCGDDALDVPSPTYTLVQMYDAPMATVWHFDLYRLKEPDEVIELGWEEAREGIALVEWPDRLGPYLPKRSWRIAIGGTGNGRSITMEKS